MRVSLEKWYLDVVDAHGSAAILYWVRLSFGPWRSLRLGRAALMLAGPSGVQTLESARAGPPPTVERGEVRWAHRGLAARGTWRPVAPACRRSLGAAEGACVDWACHAPRAEVDLRVGDRAIRGLGYAEQLTLELLPWRLQLDELRWGRVAARKCGAVWIDWRGATPLSVLLVDGVEQLHPAAVEANSPTAPLGTRPLAQRGAQAGAALDAGLRIDERGVVWPGGRIDFTNCRTLRDAPILDGALGSAHRLAKLVPDRVRRAHETKWLSRASIWLAGASGVALDAAPRAAADPAGSRSACEEGWAIHERVRFSDRSERPR